MTARLKRDDEVLILRGKDNGKRGKVQKFLPAQNLILVEGLNRVKRHLKAGAQGARQAGIIEKEMPMNASKVMPICPNCDKPTRIGIQVLDDGSKTRMCKRCNSMIN
jgi:large subunit ribosomal protein L24